MSIEERIEKIKDAKLSKALDDAKIKGVKVEIPLELIEKITKKLDLIEEGAQRNHTLKEIEEIIEIVRFNANTLDGMRAEEFSVSTHGHKEFDFILSKDEFKEFKKQLDTDTSKLANNLIDIFHDIEDIRNDDKLEKEIIKVKNQSKDLSASIQKLKRIENAVTKEQLQKELEKLSKKATDYTNTVAQRVAGMSRGGGGPYVGPTAPSNPAIGATWVDTS